MEKRFLADSMLGRLAKWLRVMGYDTHYQRFYNEQEFQDFISEGRSLLSKNRKTIKKYPDALLILSDHVKDQLHEMRDMGMFSGGRGLWFSRCLICNMPLRDARAEDAREGLPEYIFFHNSQGIRFCPSCGRYYWPGSHREKMIHQLETYGF